MKKAYLVIGLVFSLLMSGWIILSDAQGAGIVGSGHDLRGKNSIPASTPVCEVCHIPHNASTTQAALWNHAATAVAYTNNITSSFGTAWGQPSGVSLVCLSCHDGTVAPDQFGTNPGTPSAKLTGSKKIGSGTPDPGLKGQHPVSVLYWVSKAGWTNEFKPIADAKASGIVLYGAAGSERVECGSCHDVHNKAVVEGKLLRAKYDTSSGLDIICLACHNK